MGEINIIGLHGKKQSGKDTVYKIIEYLDYIQFIAGIKNENVRVLNLSYTSFRSQVESLKNENIPFRYKSDWENKKFADKLKQIVALLIGCKIEDLEDETFKNSYLPNEWLDVNYGTKEFSDDFKNKSTVREFLQYLGTNCLRNVIHPDTHVNALFADYKKEKTIYQLTNTANTTPTKPNIVVKSQKWIISDVRFENEVKAIKERGGIVVQIVNPRINSQDEHESETALDQYNDFDYALINDGTIEDLVEKVQQMLIYFNI